jgi:hypothetical protein
MLLDRQPEPEENPPKYTSSLSTQFAIARDCATVDLMKIEDLRVFTKELLALYHNSREMTTRILSGNISSE